MLDDPIVITSYARTPIGAFQGVLAEIPAPKLGSIAIKEAVTRSKLSPQQYEEVIMGCVLPAGQGQAPARQAALYAGLPNTVNCTTINKICGSGMKAIMLAHDMLIANSKKIMIAGGMENMSQSPYLLPKARAGYRMGHNTVKDHMFLDGLEDAYSDNKLMGTFADATAAKLNYSRETQDQFALNSLQKAQHAINNQLFMQELVPVQVETKKGILEITEDEIPSKAKPEKIPTLKPAFAKDGTVTAANASSIADGAAACTLMRASTAKYHNIKPIAKIIGHCSKAQEPNWFTTAPIGAIQNLLTAIDWNINDVDLFEINEAFAVVSLAAIGELSIPAENVNIHGGACALGHPIGASGARIVCTLLAALEHTNKQRGVATLCIGGGEATAIALELVV